MDDNLIKRDQLGLVPHSAAASVYTLEAGSCRVLQNEVIDGPAMLLLKIPQAELSGAAGYPQSNPTCVLR